MNAKNVLGSIHPIFLSSLHPRYASPQLLIPFFYSRNSYKVADIYTLRSLKRLSQHEDNLGWSGYSVQPRTVSSSAAVAFRKGEEK